MRHQGEHEFPDKSSDFDETYILRKFAHQPVGADDLRMDKGCLCPSCFMKAHGYRTFEPVDDMVHHVQMTYSITMIIARTLHEQMGNMDPDQVSVSAMMSTVTTLADLVDVAQTLEGVVNMLWENEKDEKVKKSPWPSVDDLIKFIERDLLSPPGDGE